MVTISDIWQQITNTLYPLYYINIHSTDLDKTFPPTPYFALQFSNSFFLISVEILHKPVHIQSMSQEFIFSICFKCLSLSKFIYCIAKKKNKLVALYISIHIMVDSLIWTSVILPVDLILAKQLFSNQNIENSVRIFPPL